VPLYRYQCKVKSCDSKDEHEFLISYTDNEVPLCPKCKTKMAKLMSTNLAFTLSGRGWEKDGYS